MPRREKSLSRHSEHSESAPQLVAANAVAAGQDGAPNINLNLTINNGGLQSRSNDSADGISLADHTFGGASPLSRSGAVGMNEIVEVARSPTHKKRRGNMKAGDKQKGTIATAYTAVGGFDRFSMPRFS